jgi:hypothetical protein
MTSQPHWIRQMQQNRELLDSIAGQNSALRAVQENRKLLDLITGQASVVNALQQNRAALDAIAGQASVLNALQQNRAALDAIAGQASVLNALQQNRAVLDAIAGQGSVINALQQSSSLLDSIVRRSGFASMIGVKDTLSQIASRPAFGSMVAARVMPRPAWDGVLQSLRDPIDDVLLDDAIAEFEAAASVGGDAVDDTWWIARLPFVAQVALLLIVLQLLDSVSKFVGEVTGEDVPPTYRSATQVLFALAAALLAFIEAKAEVAQVESDSDEPEKPDG